MKDHPISAADNGIVVTPLIEEEEDKAVLLYENVLSESQANQLLAELPTLLDWKVETDDFGPQARPTYYMGDASDCVFSYVGLQLQPHDWPPSLRDLSRQVAQACQLLASDPESSSPPRNPLTACLANLYPAGQGHIPWHCDEIRAHGDAALVASLSLGGPRRFQLRRRTDVAVVADLLLPSGSVLLMKGPHIQELYEHCLPLEKDTAPLRVSLTFRSIVPGYEQALGTIAKDSCCSSTTPTTTNGGGETS
mmetsp:Transcript_11387/g.23338  ORF Transcript_11387/g.23338 Transcript_11387/m.23338 type:complete len:251 (-) Transcript_11387:265-1017(-)|eukprot:CAMPEP_0172466328 /NCGR_PEP_ID=MMETSP1065-20121228/55834_1 /TAXON_ID=265537 /ORGANISM="Amphiprora paludosa, Strain CCMP125" /LENGTH=250 /DNA_ID=CAMNT_0013223091 /DNA_START=23 /DNA_END=775 /DNA_ORIENTATION=+